MFRITTLQRVADRHLRANCQRLCGGCLRGHHRDICDCNNQGHSINSTQYSIQVILKLIGWAGVGAFAVFKQTWAENLEDKKPKHMTYAQNYTKPRYFEVLLVIFIISF